MFDILMRDEAGAGVPVPLPGRGMVYLGLDGLMYTKREDGTVMALPSGPQGPQGVPGAAGDVGAQGPQGVQGPAGAQGSAGTVLVPAFSVGAYTLCTVTADVQSVMVGDTVTATGANLYAQTNGTTNRPLDVGQVWRLMGCIGGRPATTFLFQRVA